MIPLQIRITDNEVSLTAADVPYGVAMVSDLEFAFLVDVDGEMTVMSPYEFACYDASCRPPTSGGTGGSVSKGGARKAGGKTDEDIAADKAEKRAAKKANDAGIAAGASTGTTPTGAPSLTEAKLDALFPGRKDTHKSVNSNGTLSIGGLDEKGGLTAFSKEGEAKIQQQWDDLGHPKQAYVDNLVAAGKLAIGVDLKTGKIVDHDVLEAGLKNSVWYNTAHADAKGISDATGINLDNVVAATTVLSAGRQWSGTRSGNAETARTLADIAANPRDIVPTQAALDLMAWKREKSTKGPGQIGLHNDTPPLKKKLEAGKKLSTNDIDSATLVELMYAVNATRGHESFKQWADLTTKDGKVGMKSSPLSDKVDPIYPLFTSKGTHQVKQAMALMRGEITARQAITGPKFSSFYSNIRRPDVDYSITNDVWQYRIQAGNLKLNSGVTATQQAKFGIGDKAVGTISELTIGPRAVNSAQGLLQTGAASKADRLASGDGMFRDSTGMMRSALKKLAVDYPAQFGTMKGHEFQALVWVHFGGGVSSDTVRTSRWDAGLAQMREVGL